MHLFDEFVSYINLETLLNCYLISEFLNKTIYIRGQYEAYNYYYLTQAYKNKSDCSILLFNISDELKNGRIQLNYAVEYYQELIPFWMKIIQEIDLNYCMSLACKHKNIELIHYFFSKGADPRSGLWDACINGSFEIVKLLYSMDSSMHVSIIPKAVIRKKILNNEIGDYQQIANFLNI